MTKQEFFYNNWLFYYSQVGGDDSLPTFRPGNTRKLIGQTNFTSRKLGLLIIPTSTKRNIKIIVANTGACPGFLKGGGGPISLGSLKKGHQILKGGGGPMV